jgi:myo-inositol-1(or 4)-monophosphatase
MIDNSSTDASLLADVVTIVENAAAHLAERFTPDARPGSSEAVADAIYALNDAIIPLLQAPLLAARPGSQWVDDELDGGALPLGEWWVIDPAEGAVNHVHGITEFAVTATLVRDNLPVLTVVRLPMAATTYTAIAGKGAWQDGVALRPSDKTELTLAMAGTGQARPGEDAETYRRIGESVTAVLNAGAVVQVSVPATLQLIHVAAGRRDVFWQFSNVRSGLAAGALLVAEAGGRVTDTHGEPWSVASRDLLATAPRLHGDAVEALSGIR